MTARRLLFFGGVGVISVAGYSALSFLRSTTRLAEDSALLSLGQQLREEAENYERVHGTHPASLADLRVDYGRTDGARPEMLDCFAIETSNETFTILRKPSCAFGGYR